MFVDVFLDAHGRGTMPPTIPCTATKGRFFHGYYDCWCYLPLYVFCRQLLAAKLRRSHIDAAAGAKDAVARLVARIRRRWPEVRILLRADSGCAREELMAWGEDLRVDYLFGLAGNSRLLDAIVDLAWAAGRTPGDGQAGAAVQGLLLCHPRQLEPAATGDRQGRAPGQGRQPALHRHLAETQGDRCPDPLRTGLLCRGEMENRIKECQLDLLADRTSTATMAANQLRLWFSSFACVLLEALRRIGLPHTELAQATCGSIRPKLLKLGARVTVSVRRIEIAIASACPHHAEFAPAHARLRAPPGAGSPTPSSE